jgi:predicted nucleic acid-binding protein
MEEIFVDTSALYALVGTEDEFSEQAASTWERLAQSGVPLITNNYILAECFALVQNRLGLEYIRHLQSTILPLLKVEWVNEEQHMAAVQTVLTTNRRNLGLVDCSAFETMHRLDIQTVFTFDEHFREQGFNVIP